MEIVDPDTLLKKIGKKGLSGDMVLSIILHALLIGLTSFGLYASWAKWGIHAPNEIKRLEKAAAKEEAQKAAAEKAKEEAAKKAEEAASAKNDSKDAKAKDAKAAAQPAAADAAKGAPAAEKKADDGKPKQLPLDQQVAKPPKSFDLDGIDL